jgi:hypothetical protein
MYLDDAVKNTEQFEGRVNHMYLDSKGNVTVAVGLMIPTTAAALNLPFKRRGLGQDFPASQLEILDDYNRVKAASVGHVATYYHNAESVILEDAEIDSQLLSWLKGLDQELAASTREVGLLGYGLQPWHRATLPRVPAHECGGGDRGVYAVRGGVRQRERRSSV